MQVRQAVYAVSLLIALSACPGKKTSGEQPPPVVTDGGSGGGSTLVDYSYINPSNVCAEVVKFFCARLKASGCLAPAAEASCQSFMTDSMGDCFTTDVAGMVRAGYMKWDAAAVNACFNAEKDRKTCGGRFTDPSCENLITSIPAAAGAACPSAGWGNKCDATSYCKPGASSCLGTCTLKGSPGAVCDWNWPCDSATYCKFGAGATGICTALVALNGACTSSEECGPAAYCAPATNTCQARKPVGQSCADTFSACAAPGTCHPNTQICVPERMNGAVGDTCDQGGWPQGCAPDLYCAGATGTTPGHCAQKLAAASPCVASDYSCADPLICKGGTCVPPGDLGATCASDVDCLMGLWCTANQCALYPALGQACAPANDRCVGSRCDSTTLKCVARMANGSGCSVNSDCQSLVCNGSPSSSCLAACTY